MKGVNFCPFCQHDVGVPVLAKVKLGEMPMNTIGSGAQEWQQSFAGSPAEAG